MSVQQINKIAYGLSDSLLQVPNGPIIANRNPTTSDKAQLGTLWINVIGNSVYIITSIVDNMANWASTTTNSLDELLGDTGTATPTAGAITIAGDATNISTSAAGSTVTVSLDPSISLPATNTAGTQGTIYIGGNLFVNNINTTNTYIGPLAGNLDNTLDYNTALGFAALENVDGDYNTAAGADALVTLVGGTENTALGYSAGNGVVSGISNIFIGYRSGTNYAGAESSNILIGNAGVVSESHVIRIGTPGSGTGQQNQCYIAGNVTIDTNIYLPNTNTSQTQGIIFYNNIPFIQNYGTNNTFIGANAANTTLTGTHNVALGTGALLSATSGNDNVALGAASGVSLTSGSSNTLVGENSGSTLTSGSNNIIVGYEAATNYISSESSNIIIGNAGIVSESNVIRIGTEGSGSGQQDACYIAGNLHLNDAIFLPATSNSTTGVLYLGSDRAFHEYGTNNTFIGGNAGNFSLTGSDNTSAGYNTLNALTSGEYNSAFGYFSLYNLLSGTNNISLGALAGTNYIGSESSNIVIGNYGEAAESNVIRIGTQGSSAGQQDKAYLAGVNGVTTGSPTFVTIDTVTNQLGTSSGTGGSSTIITTYTSGSGTHTLNSNTKIVEVMAWSAGSGGGSGRRGATTAAGGGGGGSSGGGFFYDAPVSFFGGAGASVSYQVGVGGSGGAAVTTDNTNGNPGTLGTDTIFGNLTTTNGNPGQIYYGAGGSTGTTTTPAANIFYQNACITSVSSGATGTNTTGSNVTNYPYSLSASTSGGGGSGANSSTAQQAGNASSIYTSNTLTLILAGGAGGIETGTINGGSGNDASTATGIMVGGTGGGGGGGQSTGGSAGTGGHGGYPGGGGGGGGGSLNGTNSGAGGNGADGKLIVIEYL